ncbi:Thioesterase/thiol ester dehydrase-isomerase [Stereum hirsutum FP-91666 SS1]|uniref:Thioesterase/thiol ester dehydrase-isomerase n=1 Tax=Stereum hirsutum (strain FP-91666) TaxID=721885 RepID=UPI000440D4A4|nr:Thioesterase/thiol ester dehydrase-isomerase [Stereum hirsutum FP-91666 SS1]EIM87504.1 Thioesterase/thiol ester dehydrase-isomerase [Stereum hirsutum FP-91666 SS1]
MKSVPKQKPWIDPYALPKSGDISHVEGNVSNEIKQLVQNTFVAYGIGDDDCFAAAAGRQARFKEVRVSKKRLVAGKEKVDCTTVWEAIVTKSMVNGAGMLHGGCIAYLADNTPLLVLGFLQDVNGVGVTQGLSISYHSPAPIGTCLRIESNSIALGSRIMAARCEMTDKKTGRVVASALLNKMQPVPAKM